MFCTAGYPDSLLYCAEVISPGLEVIVLKCHQETNSPCPHQVSPAQPSHGQPVLSPGRGRLQVRGGLHCTRSHQSCLPPPHLLCLHFPPGSPQPPWQDRPQQCGLRLSRHALSHHSFQHPPFNIYFLFGPGIFGKSIMSNLTEFIFPKELLNNSINISFCSQGYFTSIAMFSWMTVFCFDLCRTFCTSTSPNREQS